MKDRISQITQRWFLSEEALFSAFCTHYIELNSSMKCAMRTGKGVIEVNPCLCADMTDKEVEERLAVEVIRILLKHPYDRQPEGCCNTARALGSNCVIGDSYRLRHMSIERPGDFKLPSNGHYEFYARNIQKMMDKSEDGQGDGDSNSMMDSMLDSNSEAAEAAGEMAMNWQKDELMSAQINETIKNVNSWGTLDGNIVERIVASTKARIDYKKALAM